MFYFSKIRSVSKLAYPSACWNFSRHENAVYLTFDDGPNPIITPWVLDLLAKHKMKATFFCLAKNVIEYPEIYRRIIREGHAVGNHSYDHPNGWQTKSKKYLANIELASKTIDSNLFRPPYGKMRLKQYQTLQKKYSIIMWDVLSGDFDQSINAEQCYENCVEGIENGSIIVFHDSEKAFDKLREFLPSFFDDIHQNFDFRVIKSPASY